MDIDRDLISELLAATLASARFERSRRQAELLSYIVSETLESRGEQISAYSIAFDVMGRNASFDPKIDSIVRVEMHRLRLNLLAWRDDPENSADACLIIGARQYLPRVVERDPMLHYSNRTLRFVSWVKQVQHLSLSRKITLALIPIGLSTLVISLSLALRSPSDCRSQRPGLIVPGSIEDMADAGYSDDLLTRLNTFLGYYPLVSPRTASEAHCSGVPQFKLNLRFQKDGIGRWGILATLVDLQKAKPVWHALSSLNRISDSGQRDLAMARIAFALGYDSGAVQLAALGDDWSDLESEAEFRCLMLSHQYFISNYREFYKPARSCLIEYYDKSIYADSPSMLAAIELERWFDSTLVDPAERNYYDSAIATASQIDPNNTELMIIRLRAARILPSGDTALSATLAKVMKAGFPFEPHILNQLAITQARKLGEPALADANIRQAEQIADELVDMRTARVYAHVAANRISELKPFIVGLLRERFFLSNLIVILYGDNQDDPWAREAALADIAQSDCKTRACLLGELSRMGVSTRFRTTLGAVVMRHFPT